MVTKTVRIIEPKQRKPTNQEEFWSCC